MGKFGFTKISKNNYYKTKNVLEKTPFILGGPPPPPPPKTPERKKKKKK
jgi:hypothetical protein